MKTESTDKTAPRVIRKFKLFTLWREWPLSPSGDGERMEMEIYRTHDGHYIDARFGKRRPVLVKVLDHFGIAAELASPDSTVCSVGSSSDGRWHGWSHRAHCSFGFGDKIFEQCFGDDETPFTQHGDCDIETDADAKLSAVRFARYVS